MASFGRTLISMIPNRRVRSRLTNWLRKRPALAMLTNVQRLIAQERGGRFPYQRQELNYWEPLLYLLFYYDRNRLEQKPVVLDIGCAYGTLSVFCKMRLAADVHAIDFVDCYFPKRIFEETGIAFKIFNIERDEGLPFDKQYDIIIFTETLEHLNFNPIPTMQRIRSMLKKNGRLFLSTPNSEFWGIQNKYYQKFSDIPAYSPEHAGSAIIDDHVWQYNWAELMHIVNEAGFLPIEITTSHDGRHLNCVLQNKIDVDL